MSRAFDPDGGEDILPDVEQEATLEEECAFAEFNTWLRTELGRRLTVALIAPPSGADEVFTALGVALAAYPEVLVLLQTPRSSAAAEAERVMLAIAPLDPDAVLVALGGGTPVAQLTDSASIPALRWPRDVLAVGDRLGLRLRAFFALVGEAMTREGARRLGYEDSFSPHMRVHDLVAVLAREALAHEQSRRHGSSPPCYL
jgi:hypothetical protein